ncbi:MAG: septum formation initiator family protein [Sphingomonadaceae bacterium]|nr:septum formation initiator family protein [Sphingomonadaceae bacterium]
MAKAKRISSNLRAALTPALAIIVVAFFGGYALFGSNGVLAWSDYARRLQLRRTDLAQLERKRAVLSNRVALVDPRHANPDMVDELVRRDLGVAHPDEVIVPLK